MIVYTGTAVLGVVYFPKPYYALYPWYALILMIDDNVIIILILW